MNNISLYTLILLHWSQLQARWKGDNQRWAKRFYEREKYSSNRQTPGESASLPQYLGCNTVFDMCLRVTFLRRNNNALFIESYAFLKSIKATYVDNLHFFLVSIIEVIEKDLQKIMDVLNFWCTNNALYVNVNKFNIMHFRNPSVSRTDFNFTVNGNLMDCVNRYQYLGLLLT
jgi:hypothetical protein